MDLESQAVPYTLWQLVAYFLGLGTYGFGGPVALIGYMHRDLVERRQWIIDADFREGVALAQWAPGRVAAQLAVIYCIVAIFVQKFDKLFVPPNSVVKFVESTIRKSPARCCVGRSLSRQLNSRLPAVVKGCGRSGSTCWRASPESAFGENEVSH